MKISLAADHAGFKYKELIKKYLTEKGFEVIDHGTFSVESVDYPDFIKKAAADVSSQNANLGIGVCGSGIGVSMAANKVKGIRAALVLNKEMAALSKRHNNANFLALSQNFINENDLPEIIESWLNSNFEGGRHQRRVEKID
jgi:ribose 5-phosphate isomerase B